MRVAKELWSKKPPSCKYVKFFGCKAYYHISKELWNKLAPKSKKCIYLGYGEPREMGFKLWDLESRKIVRNHSIFFDESKMHKKPLKIVEI